MPMPIAAKVGVIAVSVAVAAAIAIYESPELQRAANDLRRRIAIALHAFGDRITPEERENLFNRPEDAEGFLRSRSRRQGSHNDPGVEADEETLRRQREEIMYWNAIRESKEKLDELEKKHHSRASPRLSTFDGFMQQDNTEPGALKYQTGHEVSNQDGLIRRRGTDGLRGLNHSVITNPFADEHGIEDAIALENSLMDPSRDEVSDIYSATEIGDDQTIPNAPQSEFQAPKPESRAASSTLEREVGDDEYMTAGQPDRDEAYSSIQAWAHGASYDPSVYSPPPISLAATSEAEFLSDGGLTPADSASLAGSGVDVAAEAMSTRDFDVMSDDSGMDTPTSWTDVESTAGESEIGAVRA